MAKHILGAHFSIAGGLHNALLTAQQLRCECAQLFVGNQRRWQKEPLTKEQVTVFRKVRDQSKLKSIVAHASYLINLAASDDTIYQKSLDALTEDYVRCNQLGIDYLVLHPGAHTGQGEQKGLDKIIAALNSLFKETGKGNCRILLETTAGQGSCVGHRFEQLGYILNQLKKTAGVCLDTCHVFAAGYELRTRPGYQQTMKSFDRLIGIKNLAVIHVNDSKTEFSSHVDRHERLGKGFIGREGFINLLADNRLKDKAFILETPKGQSPGGRDLDKLNLAALRRWERQAK